MFSVSDLPSGIVVLRFAVLGSNLDVAVLTEVDGQHEQDPEFLQSSLYKTKPSYSWQFTMAPM